MAKRNGKQKKINVDDITTHFKGLEDPRSEINRRHKLLDIVVISVCAAICGADQWHTGPRDIHGSRALGNADSVGARTNTLDKMACRVIHIVSSPDYS